MRRFVMGIVISALLTTMLILVTNVNSFPTFARKYKTSCSTCHYAFPRLNKFGKAFLNNGYRYPGDDKDFAKEETVSLGSESQKKVFPDAIWPSDLPGTSVFSGRFISRLHYDPNEAGKEFSFENPHELEVFMVGTMGEKISFVFELEWEHADEFDYGGNLDYKFSDPFHIRVGNIEYLPVHDHTRFSVAHLNYGKFRGIPSQGIELWGAANGSGNKGGFVYNLGFFNGQNDGEDNVDLNSQKDLFVKASYKIGGMGVLGSTESSESSAFWKDNSLTLGGFAHGGVNDDHSRNLNFGGNFDYFLENLNLFGVYLVSRKKTAGSTDWIDTKRTFAEADYVIYPWLIPTARFEYTKEDNVDAVKHVVPAFVIMLRANLKIVPTGFFDLDNSDENKYAMQIDVGF